MKIIVITIFIMFSCISFASKNKILTGDDVADIIHEANFSTNVIAKFKVTTIFSSKHTQVREIIASHKMINGKVNFLSVFLKPSEIIGSSLLLQNDQDGKNKYFYLPASKASRVKRITTSSNRLANPEFSFEFLHYKHLKEQDHRILNQNSILDENYWILQSTPKDPDTSPYGMILAWVLKRASKPNELRFFDKDYNLVRVFEINDLKNIDGHWTMNKATIEDIEKNRTIVLELLAIKYDTDIPDSFFDKDNLNKPEEKIDFFNKKLEDCI